MNLIDNIFQAFNNSFSVEEIVQNPLFLVDFMVVLLLFYGIYRMLRNTRALRIFYGLIFIALMLFVSVFFNLTLLSWVLGVFLTITVVAIPIVFQPELRNGLERLGRTGLKNISAKESVTAKFIKPIMETVVILSKNKIGAIIVIQRKTGLREFMATGTIIDAEISKNLLLSFFLGDSPLHDGAVIISKGRIASASSILPLSENDLVTTLGTRHKAAMGVAEQTDALVIVVSEKTGKISLAEGASFFKNIAEKDLTKMLEESLKSEIKKSRVLSKIIK